MEEFVVVMSSGIGQCDFCSSNNVHIAECEWVSVMFEQLFELYEVNTNYNGTNESTLLYQQLIDCWDNLFSKELSTRAIKQLVDQIGRGSSIYSKNLFERPVQLSFLNDPSNALAENLQSKWDNFSNEIKGKNRFFISEMFDSDGLESVFTRLAITYPAGTAFYRARISDNILSADELSKPPANLATPGRANPVGIPYLYVSDSDRTTLHETRVALHQGVSIGKFVTKTPISLVSLKNIMQHGPFEISSRGFAIDEFLKYRPYLLKLGDELSRPVRKQDEHLDYLPTQFLCEYIKSKLGFDAVEYKSSMNSDGYNLAVFNDSKLECVDVKFYRVTNLEYNWSID